MIENSKHGVILFTMGSMVPISKMKAEDRMLFIRVFSKLQQLVLWKSDIDLPNLPDNVRVFKWLPQRGILGVVIIFFFCNNLYFEYFFIPEHRG